MTTTATLCTSLLLLCALPCSGVAQQAERQRAIRFENKDLRSALDSLMRWYGVSIVYYDDHVSNVHVTAVCDTCSATEALGLLLDGTGLTWLRMGTQFVLRQRPEKMTHVTADLSGVITDSLSGSWIAGAVVLLEKEAPGGQRALQHWCPTNAFGFYSLRDVAPGEYLLSIRAMGYAADRRSFRVDADNANRADVALRQMDIPMHEFTVEGHRTESTPAGGLVRGTYVRSIPSDQTQYLLDGANIYNPSHFGGVLSTFQPDVLNDVESAVNGLSPYYGGRISGLLDLSLREGSAEGFSGVLGVGSLGAHLLLEGPINERSTFLLSGRRAYVEPFVPFLGESDLASRSGSFELLGKTNYRLSASSRLFASGYVGGDTYRNTVEGGNQRLDNTFAWENQNLQCRWFSISSSSLFFFSSIGYSRYHLSLEHDLTGQGASQRGFVSDYKIEDLSIRAHAEHFYDENHTVKGGVELTGHGITGDIGEFSLCAAPFSLHGFSSWELAVYIQDQWRLSRSVTAELGARVTSFMGSGGARSGVDPRFSLLALLDDHSRLFASLTSINEFVHPYRNTGAFYFYPTVFWYPSDNEVKPTTSLQLTGGIERDWGDEAYVASLEAYYRTTQNYHGFGVLVQSAAPSSLQTSLLYGTERAYGGSLSVRKRFGVFSGSLRYTLGWLFDAFPTVHLGEEFASAFDRRHELELWVSWMPSDDWTVSGVCVVASEPPLSRTTESSPGDVLSTPHDVLNTPGVVSALEGSRTPIDANGSKSPGFQRLEINIAKRIDIWGIPGQFVLRMMNAYGLLDPFAWALSTNGNPRNMWVASLKDLNLFPLYPSLGLTVRL